MEPKKFNLPKDFLSDRQKEEHLKLYKGYVEKTEAVGEKIKNADPEKDDIRNLRLTETFVVAGMKLHEWYFEGLGRTEFNGKIKEMIEEKWKSFENFKKMFIATAMAMRGWVVLAYDNDFKKLKIYGGDMHDIAIWNCKPVLVLDVYEHAYFIDYGTNRKQYIEDFFINVNWKIINLRIKEEK